MGRTAAIVHESNKRRAGDGFSKRRRGMVDEGEGRWDGQTTGRVNSSVREEFGGLVHVVSSSLLGRPPLLCDAEPEALHHPALIFHQIFVH